MATTRIAVGASGVPQDEPEGPSPTQTATQATDGAWGNWSGVTGMRLGVPAESQPAAWQPPDASPRIGRLALALSKAQAQIEGASKSATNPHFKSRYADLASVWDACREALTSNELAVVQTTTGGEGRTVVVRTTLMHSSGEWICGELTMTPLKPGPQELGSCITYARRYALAAMVGVAPEDDDGEAAEGRRSGEPRQLAGQSSERQYTVKRPAEAETDALLQAQLAPQENDPEPKRTEQVRPLVEQECSVTMDRLRQFATGLKLDPEVVSAIARESYQHYDSAHDKRERGTRAKVTQLGELRAGDLKHFCWRVRTALRGLVPPEE